METPQDETPLVEPGGIIAATVEIQRAGSKKFLIRDGPFRAECFIAAHEGRCFAYRNMCPHAGTPLDWTPNDDALFYASVTTGHRAGGYNLANFSSVDTYDPEELIAYEIGYKGQLMDGLLQVDLSAYYYDYETIHMEADVPSALSANM